MNFGLECEERFARVAEMANYQIADFRLQKLGSESQISDSDLRMAGLKELGLRPC